MFNGKPGWFASGTNLRPERFPPLAPTRGGNSAGEVKSGVTDVAVLFKFFTSLCVRYVKSCIYFDNL